MNTFHNKLHGRPTSSVVIISQFRRNGNSARWEFGEVVGNLHLQPQVVHCDYEMAVFNAVQLEWGVQATGCLFHCDQSIFRHLQAIGLQVNYNTDNPPGVRKWLRRIMALPLVPPLRLPGVYQEIKQQAPPIPEVPIMHQYVEQTYMSQNGSLFSAAQWNVFGTVNRTINMCEGFHRALNEAVSIRHPSIYRLIQVFQDIEAANERNIAQLTLGAAPKKSEPNTFLSTKLLTGWLTIPLVMVFQQCNVS
jgi:hypothetical protein